MLHDALHGAATVQPGPLREVRASIDRIDRAIVDLLAERRAHALRAARLKPAGALHDAAREAQVLANVTRLARQRDLDPALVTSLYRELIAGCLRAEVAATRPPKTAQGGRHAVDELPAPEELKRELPLSDRAAATVEAGRRGVEAILAGRDPRLLLVVGPCSIHDTGAALEYARRLRALAAEVSDALLLVMRVYLEKPRSSVGWEGFTHDPRLDGSFRVAEGLARGRRLLLAINELGLPVGSEMLDPLAPRYHGELVSWYAVGARTAESQTHRNVASGLAAPVGIKNATDGRVEPAVNAILAASRPHAVMGIDERGRCAVLRTRGNPHAHLVLRGGASGPNHDRRSIAAAEEALRAAGLRRRLVIDCSHGNSGKDAAAQPAVALDAVRQLRAGNASIAGLMLESFLEEGSQPLTADPARLRYGCSITDPCLGWEATAAVVRALRDALAGGTGARLAP